MLIDQPEAEYDVVIAGGGLTGGSFSLLLQTMLDKSSLRILLVDSAPLAAASSASDEGGKPFDARSTALSWGSRLIYEQAGLWQKLAPDVTAIHNIHVSDKGHVGATRLHSAEMNVDALGYVAENHNLNKVIADGLLDSQLIQAVAPASVTAVKPLADGVQLLITAATGSYTIKSRLLVIADGGRSSLCEQLGIRIKSTPYGQKALISNIAFEQAHHGCAFERFTDTGPLAVLPLPDLAGEHRAALVWTLEEEQVPDVMSLSDDAFLSELQSRFGFRLGQLRRVGERHLYPLSLNLAEEQIRPGIVLLGNVAHTLHPVAGQGLNLALRDARELAGLIATAAATDAGKMQIGSFGWLQKFEQRQQKDQQQTIRFSDLTTRLFSNKHPALALGRNMGLLSMELLPPARRWFAKQAMGMTDRRTGM